MEIPFFMFMSLTEALFFSIWCLCRWQKHFFSPFGVYVVDRSTFFLHLVFMSLSEALFFSIWCLCHCQKHFFSPFSVYFIVRSTFFSISCLLHFVLSNHGYAAIIIFLPLYIIITKTILSSSSITLRPQTASLCVLIRAFYCFIQLAIKWMLAKRCLVT